MISIKAFLFCTRISLMFILSILFPLAVTLVIETGVYMILKHRDLKLFLAASIMNLVLNPTMNTILIQFGDTAIKYWLILIIGEVSTTLIESLIVFFFMRFKYLKILLFAVLANISSFLLGLALNQLYDYRTVLIVITILFLCFYTAMYFLVLILFIRKNRGLES